MPVNSAPASVIEKKLTHYFKVGLQIQRSTVSNTIKRRCLPSTAVADGVNHIRMIDLTPSQSLSWRCSKQQ